MKIFVIFTHPSPPNVTRLFVYHPNGADGRVCFVSWLPYDISNTYENVSTFSGRQASFLARDTKSKFALSLLPILTVLLCLPFLSFCISIESNRQLTSNQNNKFEKTIEMSRK